MTSALRMTSTNTDLSQVFIFCFWNESKIQICLALFHFKWNTRLWGLYQLREIYSLWIHCLVTPSIPFNYISSSFILRLAWFSLLWYYGCFRVDITKALNWNVLAFKCYSFYYFNTCLWHWHLHSSFLSLRDKHK